MAKRLINTKQLTQEIGFSIDTLYRYRRDNILKKGVDWQYGDAYGRSILYDLENVQKAIHEHASKRLETV
nr:hypothetical protein [uncultured Mediterranean phage uvMED]BAR26553.1 hypothetical protein [uncultured Mediterranean phage uvMED]BAR26653.1 hypothetical protein [uncultured Mediterranean phage uvMED]BAR26707.1 hypothetical protein [uncultured Mediterranean phage uvMED]BAR26745.1 hypothetical protein [uncultured Mediterranean phage uvMED]|tara:strand:- start:1865 stop:2074 length:210 start_codon:yes stop_codon:yes gene_type:complete